MAKAELTEWDTDLTAPLDEEYEALVRAIRYAQGFSLLFVQCSPAQSEKLIARVCDDVVDKTVDVLRLESEVDDLYDTVAALPNIDKTNVLLISGLEKSLAPYIKPGYGSEGDYYAKDSIPKILGKLNLQRENFRETFKLCFVFLVPLYAMKYLIRRAADFFDWRSGVWEFLEPKKEFQKESQRLLDDNDFNKYRSLTPQQRRERFLVIEDLLERNSGSTETTTQLLREQGKLLSAEEDHRNALNYYEKALSLKPNDYKALNAKGTTLDGLGRSEEAINCYDAALIIKADYDYVLNNKGVVLASMGRYKEAIASYDAALAIKPSYYKALNNKGYALGDLGRHEEAIASYDAALAIKSDDPATLYNKGISLGNLGRHEAAVACYDSALAIKPDYYYALNNKGYTLGNLGRHEEAIACYDVALAITPDDHIALNNKGIALRNLGCYEDAIACYDAALAIKPDYQLAINNKKEVLEKLTNTSH